MLKNPLAYGISADKKADDPMLRSHCMELVRDAAAYLSTNRMINFDPQSGNLGMTTLGRVAAHFYIQAESVMTFNDSMTVKPLPTDADLLMLVVSATEFENVRVRPEEQGELDNLQQKCPLELKGPINDSVTKTFVLLQMYISRIRPKGFTLISDTNYIASNAGKTPNMLIIFISDFPNGPNQLAYREQFLKCVSIPTRLGLLSRCAVFQRVSTINFGGFKAH